MNTIKKPGKRRLFVLLWGLIFLSSILIAGSSFSDPTNTNYDGKGSEQIDSLLTVQEISCGPPKSTTTPPTTTTSTTMNPTTTTPTVTDQMTTNPTTVVRETGLLLLSILGLGIALLFVLRRPRGV